MSAAQNYHARSPRYVFRSNDQSFLRFAEMGTRGVSWHATIRDLSESGLSLMLGDATVPDEGDMLKLEFTIPNRKQIACFGTVVRVEQKNEWDPEWGDRGFTLVALQFRNLPTAHRRAIQLGIGGQVNEHESVDFDWDRERRTHAFAFTGMSVALACCLLLMAQPFTAWLAPFTSYLK